MFHLAIKQIYKNNIRKKRKRVIYVVCIVTYIIQRNNISNNTRNIAQGGHLVHESFKNNIRNNTHNIAQGAILLSGGQMPPLAPLNATLYQIHH